MHHPKTVGRPGLTLPPELIGAAAPVERAADVARQAAQSDDSVLIVAEVGFCLEGIARAIHQAGPRASEAFSRLTAPILQSRSSVSSSCGTQSARGLRDGDRGQRAR